MIGEAGAWPRDNVVRNWFLMPTVPHAVGAAAAGVWGDETEIAKAAVALASRRISKASDPKTTARPASALLADAGQTITPEGLGADKVLRIIRRRDRARNAGPRRSDESRLHPSGTNSRGTGIRCRREQL